MGRRDDEQRGEFTDQAPTLGVSLGVRYGRMATGLLLGLAYGEARALELARRTAAGPVLRGGVGAQLAASTADSLIRAQSRLDLAGPVLDETHQGVVKAMGITPVLWDGLIRWGGAQGLTDGIVGLISRAADDSFFGGWLAGLPAMAERRGSAPATVKALTIGIPGTPERPVGTSHGSHGLVRTLPLAALIVSHVAKDLPRRALESCALTHGEPTAMYATGASVMTLAHHVMTGQGLEAGLAFASELLLVEGPHLVRDRFEAVLRSRTDQPRSQGRLRALTPDRSALSAAAGALYAFGDDLEADLAFITGSTSDLPAMGAVLGALHGVVRGPESLEAARLARCEMTWPMEVLGRDLGLVLAEWPAGSDERLPLPGWARRYPA